MDTDQETIDAFFDDLSQKSQPEIHLLLKNLKHIGIEDDVIERLSHEYYKYFQELNADKAIAGKPKIKRTDTKDVKRSEKFNDALFYQSTSSVVSTDPIHSELLPSVEPSPES
jgi:hypothetical protein